MNEKGFASLSLCLWLPVICTSLFSVLWMFWLIQQRMRVSNLCHHYVLKAQDELIRRNEQVLSMNSKARWLWAEKKVLDGIILAGPPQAKVAAKLRRRFIVYQQKSLRELQNQLLRTGQLQSRKALYELRRQLQHTKQDWQDFWEGGSSSPMQISIWPQNSKLIESIRDIAPVYARGPRHSQRQGLRVQWSLQLRSLFPAWLRHWVPIHKKWQGQCFSHPHKGVLKWISAIGEGNHLSKVW